jgi:hypothetical protein
MHSAKYAFVAGVECSNGTSVMISSSAFLMTSIRAGLNLGTSSTPWRAYDRHSSEFDGTAAIERFAYLRSVGAKVFPKALSTWTVGA